MSPSLLFRSLLCTAFVASLAYAPSCTEKAESSSSILRQGVATKTALSALLAEPATPWGWAGGTIDSPKNQAVLSAATPPTFAWHTLTSTPNDAGVDSTDAAPNDAGNDSGDAAPSDAGNSTGAAGATGLLRMRSHRGQLARILHDTFRLEQSAWAEDAAFSGEAYLLSFSTPKTVNVLGVFTTLTTYTPSLRAWQKLAAAGEPITVLITSAVFANDQLTNDGGPFSGLSITITIQ